MVFHVFDLQVNGFLYLSQSEFFIGLGAHSLGHHLLLDEWCELVLVFGEMLFRDTDFHHDLLLETHTNLLDLGHALSDHSEVLIEVLISFLFIVHFSVFFEVFGEFEDLFFGGFKGEDKYLFDILEGRVLHVDGCFEFGNLKIEIENFSVFLDFFRMLIFVEVIFDETAVKK